MGARLKVPKALAEVSFVVQLKAINSNKSRADSGTRLEFASIHGAESLPSTTTPDTALPADYYMWCKTVITVTGTNTDAPASIRSSPGTANSSAPYPWCTAQAKDLARSFISIPPPSPKNTAAGCWSPPGAIIEWKVTSSNPTVPR